MEHAHSWRLPTYFFRPKFHPQLYLWNNLDMNSTGIGKTMVEFFSAEIVFNVCRYRSCIADGVSAMMSAASFRERDAVISPSAAITWKRVYKDVSTNSSCHMTSLRHNSNFQINVQWNSSSGPVLQNPAFFDIEYSADISLPGFVLTGL